MKRNKQKMLIPTDVYDEAKRRLYELEGIKKEKYQALTEYPDGMIHIVNYRERAKFYLRTDKSDKSGIYIRKSDSRKIRTYVQKSYDEKVIRLIEKEISNLKDFLKKSEQIADRIRQVYSDNSVEVKDYIEPVDCSDEDYIKQWMACKYEGKAIDESAPYYETDHKERVRSKSELNIANALSRHGIPYKYEKPLKMKNGAVIYPDFTILDVRNRKQIYWEHRGMMDKQDYAEHAVFKMKSYIKSGLLPGKDLIITEESSLNMLGTDEIEAVIGAFFL
ncbi:MAG: hypothetical protein K6G12_05920 [Lachnospiraceae bacterium]|nr:hypothetical protein [Lachnospiraceae bacterium]